MQLFIEKISRKDQIQFSITKQRQFNSVDLEEALMD
jgi:hypothetical protein